MAKRVLYLIRNGQYTRTDDTAPGGPLTRIGYAQAHLTATALRDRPISAIHCSPYPQVIETAAIIAATFHGVKSQRTNRLRQYDEDGGRARNTLTRSMVLARSSRERQQLETAIRTFFRPPEGETNIHEIIICHANIIRDLICHTIGAKPETWAHMVINHCGISQVEVHTSGNAELVSYNDISHLPEELHT